MDGARPWNYSIFCFCFFLVLRGNGLPSCAAVHFGESNATQKAIFLTLTPVQHHFWEDNLKIFSRGHSKWVSNIYTCASKQTERGPKAVQTQSRSSESQLISDIKNWLLLLATSYICILYTLLNLYAQMLKVPFKMSLSSNPQRSFLRRKLQENIQQLSHA